MEALFGKGCLVGVRFDGCGQAWLHLVDSFGLQTGGVLRARNVEQVAHLDVVAPGVEGEPLPDQRHLLLGRP